MTLREMDNQVTYVQQLHQGTAGSTTFINVATWESARALGQAFSSPEFQARTARYPDSTVAAPHVFKKVAVPGICTALPAGSPRGIAVRDAPDSLGAAH